MCLGFHVFAHVFACVDDRGIHQIADDLLDVAADIADFGELRRLDLDERRTGEFSQTARNLGLAHAGGPDHQYVLGVDFVAQIVAQLLAPPAVAQGHGHGALGVLLADDEAVQFRHDFAGGEVGHISLTVVEGGSL